MEHNSDLESSIQRQLDNISRLMARIKVDIERTNEGQFTNLLEGLEQLSSSLVNLETNVVNHLQARNKQVVALAGVGSVINSSLGLQRVLDEVMDRLIELIGAERCFLMLYNADRELTVQTARGMDKADLNKDVFSISKTIVNRVAETGEVILTTNAQEDPRFGQKASIEQYHLLSILCAPLKLKDDLIGVIYVDNRAHTGIFQQSDFELITAFSNQAAVAIDNARLFDDLQIAYQATLEGWVRALDLRDKETEGHTQRVTDLTKRLAKFIGVDDASIENIERGALLHDIGKMAIPDSILLKPGDLTPEERNIIQLHPAFAYKMLSPIKFMLPALDIPYCHHEKWDGSGYPRGLKGEQIPFAARIFSVVDVWDALVSDRPYHKAMDLVEARKYIKEQAGMHFDPKIVDAFLSLEELKCL